MKKLSYLLASGMSALAALASGGATARTAQPDLRADANIVRESASSANPIAVSESARRQIGTQALEGKTLLAAKAKLNPRAAPSFADNTFHDAFKEKKHPKK